MNRIELKNCLPNVFTNLITDSELWQNDITFEKNKKYLIKADSGRGKSSFCSYIMGYRNDYGGDVCFSGTNIKCFGVKEWSSIRQNNLAYLPQGLMLFDDLTAIENIQLKNSLTNYRSIQWIEETMERFGLTDRVDFKTGKLSYGQRQRVAIIRALCQPFDFLLLDEPISHIDDSTAKSIAILIEEELDQNKAGLICTSIGKEICFTYDKIIKL